ncbi:MAG: hypothetical protein H6621_09590 [Halobacteriovoraceae bacterium]|nr:hypothetical protein [Halobacteriovoraceae bacterium]MCB9095309.1 hypothetical protein [Halobacteriovoraceae bacterium]
MALSRKIGFLFVLLSLTVQGYCLENKLQDFNAIKKLLTTNYSFYFYKQKELKFSAKRLFDSYEKQILQAETPLERENLLKRLIGEFQDIHLRVLFPSNVEILSLGFTADYVDEHFVVKKTFPEILSPNVRIEKGDMILKINGEKVDKFYQEYIKHRPVSSKYDSVKRRIVAESLFTRYPSGHMIPNERMLTVQFRSRNSGTLKSYDLPWKEMKSLHGKKITHYEKIFPINSLIKAYNLQSISKQMVRRYRGDYCGIYKEKSFFKVKVFDKGDKKVGYFRFPSWVSLQIHSEPEGGVPAFVRNDLIFIECFERLVINRLKDVDAIIFDLADNPGGSPDLSYAIASFFIGKKLERPLGRTVSTNSYYKRQMERYKIWCGEGSTHFICENWLEELQWVRQNPRFLSVKYPAFRYNSPDLEPRSPSFIKPLFVMIDANSCSASEFFSVVAKKRPAETQFIGTPTCGTGGGTIDYTDLGSSHFTALVTTGMFYVGANEEYLEGYGIKPSIPYRFTYKDFISNNKYFIRFALREALKRI